MIAKLQPYKKAATALATGLIGWCGVVIASTPSGVTASEWLGLGVVFAIAGGVYQVKNAPQ